MLGRYTGSRLYETRIEDVSCYMNLIQSQVVGDPNDTDDEDIEESVRAEALSAANFRSMVASMSISGADREGMSKGEAESEAQSEAQSKAA